MILHKLGVYGKIETQYKHKQGLSNVGQNSVSAILQASRVDCKDSLRQTALASSGQLEVIHETTIILLFTKKQGLQS